MNGGLRATFISAGVLGTLALISYVVANDASSRDRDTAIIRDVSEDRVAQIAMNGKLLGAIDGLNINVKHIGDQLERIANND